MAHTTDWRVAMAVIQNQLQQPHTHIPSVARQTLLSPGTVRRWRDNPPKTRPSIPAFVALAGYYHMKISYDWE